MNEVAIAMHIYRIDQYFLKTSADASRWSTNAGTCFIAWDGYVGELTVLDWESVLLKT